MKKHIVYLSATLILTLCTLNGKAQHTHPYLFYTKDKTDRLKERIKTDTLLANSWNTLKNRCDQWLQNPEKANAEHLAFAYVMTGAPHYAAAAKKLLLKIVNRPAWDGMDDRTPRWNAGLGTSHTNWQAAVVFDAIYNTLDKSERMEIASKIVKLGIQPSIADWLSKDNRIQSLDNMGHNWWAAVVFGAGNACLAVMNEIPEARQWAASIMENSKEWFAYSGNILENKPSNFDPAGGFYESVGYANYAMSEYLLYRLAWTNAFGPIKMPYDEMISKTIDWFMNALYPRRNAPSMSLNFGDSNDFANGERPAKILLALGMGKKYYHWYLNYTARMQLTGDLSITSPMGMLYHPENTAPATSPSLPASAIYGSMGWGMLRNSWHPDATLLSVKSGYTWNHAHADAGSFVLYHNGEYMLIDGGDINYSRPEYSSYFVTSRAHNVLMFNGEAQHPQDQYHAVKNPGHLYHLLDGGFLKYLLADATGPTSRNFTRNYRNFLWIGNVILIIDDVKTFEPGQLDFLLHFQDSAVKRGPDLEITKNNAGILFRPLYPETLPMGLPHDFPEKMKYRTELGIRDRTTDVPIPYYVISPPGKTDRTKFINAIILLDDDNLPIKTFSGSSAASGAPGRSNLPIIEKFEGNNFIGVRISQKGQVTELYFNLLADGRMMHRNANNVMNGWETDAYISALTFPENADRNDPAQITSFFLGNGSYLRKNKKVLLSSLSKVFINLAKESTSLNIQLSGQPLTRVSLASDGIKNLSVNNKSVVPRYDPDKMLLIETTDGK